MVCRKSRNSTTQNTNNTNEAATHTSIVTTMSCSDAYGVMDTQRNREAVSAVMSENAAYGAAPRDLHLNGQQQNMNKVIRVTLV